MVKRTKKEFTEYNAYHDRPFGLKWATAYAMDELVRGIEENRAEQNRDNRPLPEMNRREIDQVLYQGYTRHWPLSVQSYQRDEWGRIQDSLVGYFEGEADQEGFRLSDHWILWEDVRHIGFFDGEKWSAVHLENPPRKNR